MPDAKPIPAASHGLLDLASLKTARDASLREYVQLTPLEVMAKSIERYGIPDSVAQALFGSYTEFLQILNDEASREALENLRSENSRTDPTFKRIREVSEVFKH